MDDSEACKGVGQEPRDLIGSGSSIYKVAIFQVFTTDKDFENILSIKDTKDSRRERHSVRWHQLHKGNSVSVKYLEVEQPEPHEVCRALQLILTPNKCFHMPRNALQCPC